MDTQNNTTTANPLEVAVRDLCGKVDGETIKPDTWYMLKNGKIIEAK